MDCEQLVVLMHGYVDGGLPEWRMRAVARHLHECPGCHEGYRVEVRFRQVIATKCTEEVPHNLVQRITVALGDCAPPTATEA